MTDTQVAVGRELTDQEALALIDAITGDDFCEDLDMIAAFNPDRLTEREKTAHEKLALIYRIAHGMARSNICYERHADWRKQASALNAVGA